MEVEDNGTMERSQMNLRPKTMFAMKGRARPSENAENYLPQWSKDGEGFKKQQSSGDERRKSKVLRYTREELLALHVVSSSPPDLPEGTPVISVDSLPPVANLPFDYEEIYKQWALNRNRGRGRGRATGGDNSTRSNNNGQGNNSSTALRARASSVEEGWEKGQRRGSEEGMENKSRRWNDKNDDNWERGAKIDTKEASEDLWDDVDTGGSTLDMGLSDFAQAAERFRHEMDEYHRKQGGTLPSEVKEASPLENEGQFDDSLEEDQDPWDMPDTTAKAVDTTAEDEDLSLTSANPLAELAGMTASASSGITSNMSSGISSGMSWNLNPTPALQVVAPPPDAWFYLDPQGIQQGPFKSAEMREWFEAGYFKPHLPIRFGHEGEFASLANHFRHGQIPFASPPSPNPQAQAQAQAQAHALAMAKAQEQARQQQMLLQQQKQLEQQQYLANQLQQQRLLEQRRLQEDRMRMEMQRMEISHMHHQQQHHMQQEHARMAMLQQQQMHHQQLLYRQQQQQQQQQQQHQLHTDPTPWQQNQRNGILAALGMFGAQPASEVQQQPAPNEPAKPKSPVPEQNAWPEADSPKRTPSPKKHEEPAYESPKPVANSDKKKPGGDAPSTWGNESPQAPSLKQIQEEEQNELRNRLQKKHEAKPKADEQLADMGAQLKMMLGVQSLASPSPKKPQPSAVAPPPKPAPVTNAWKAAPSPADVPKKSLRDILAEEERLAHLKAVSSEGQPKAPSRWSSVVTGAVASQPVAPKAPRTVPTPSPQKSAEKPSVDASFWNFDNKAKEPSTNAFGGSNLSDELMIWCSKQLKKLGATEDLTLIQYCSTLEDSGEIREYLAAYLGSTPKVSAFATEFIQRKNAMNKQAKSTPKRKKAQKSDSFTDS